MKTSMTVMGLALVMSTAAAAQGGENEERNEALAECVALESDAARLACFDAVMTGDGEPDEEVRAVQERETRENFGLSDETIREQRGDPEPDIDLVLQSTVSATRKEPNGTMTFVLANGQIWRTTNVRGMRYELKVGDRVSLSEGMIGGYRLKVEGRNGVLGVERIR